MKLFQAKGIKINEFFFYIALLMFITQEYIETSRYVDIFGYTVVAMLKWGAVVLFLLSIAAAQKFKKRILIIAVGLLALFGVLYVTTNRYTLLIILILLLASRNYECNRVVDFVYHISLFFLLFIIVSSLVGIIPNTTVAQSEGERIRKTLGFDYVSFAFNYFVNILLCRIYLKTPAVNTVNIKRKSRGAMSWKEILVWLLVSFVLYHETKTNLTFLVSVFALFLYIIFVKFRWFRKIQNGKHAAGIWMWVFPFCFGITLFSCIKYTPLNTTWTAINQLANNRLLLSHEAIIRYGIHLFGAEMDMNNTALGSANIYIDSGYMQLVILYGIILTAVFLFIYMLMIRKAVRNKNTGLFIWLVCVAVFNIINSMTFDLLQNSSLLTVWILATNGIKTRSEVIGLNAG